MHWDFDGIGTLFFDRLLFENLLGFDFVGFSSHDVCENVTLYKFVRLVSILHSIKTDATYNIIFCKDRLNVGVLSKFGCESVQLQFIFPRDHQTGFSRLYQLNQPTLNHIRNCKEQLLGISIEFSNFLFQGSLWRSFKNFLPDDDPYKAVFNRLPLITHKK